MTPKQFFDKWQDVELSERSACQQHFLDLCDLLDHPKPAEVDPKGTWFTFERGVDTTDDRKGWADVWLDGKFGWEYMDGCKERNLDSREVPTGFGHCLACIAAGTWVLSKRFH